MVLTGYADVRTTVRLMEDGALTLLEKPYQPEELVAIVERGVAVTNSRRLRREDLRLAQWPVGTIDRRGTRRVGTHGGRIAEQGDRLETRAEHAPPSTGGDSRS